MNWDYKDLAHFDIQKSTRRWSPARWRRGNSGDGGDGRWIPHYAPHRTSTSLLNYLTKFNQKIPKFNHIHFMSFQSFFGMLWAKRNMFSWNAIQGERRHLMKWFQLLKPFEVCPGVIFWSNLFLIVLIFDFKAHIQSAQFAGFARPVSALSMKRNRTNTSFEGLPTNLWISDYGFRRFFSVPMIKNQQTSSNWNSSTFANH